MTKPGRPAICEQPGDRRIFVSDRRTHVGWVANVHGELNRGAFSRTGLCGGSGLASSLPVVGKQFGQAVVRVRADACEDVAQVGERIDAESLASCDETAEHRGGAAAMVAAIERPVAATDRDATQAPLSAGMPYAA